jgi:hypothetical protein
VSESSFVRYIGDPDIHDGAIIDVQHEGDTSRVAIRAASGRRFTVEFQGVSSVRSNRAEGMLLYSLSEMKAPAPGRRFVFSNWDHEDDAALEIVARDIRILER